MRFITVREVLEAVNKGRRESIDIAIKHWEQAIAAKPQDLWQGRISFGRSDCGLCQWSQLQNNYTPPCRGCPLDDAGYGCCDPASPYKEAMDAKNRVEGVYGRETPQRVKDLVMKRWRRRAQKMLNILRTLS